METLVNRPSLQAPSNNYGLNQYQGEGCWYCHEKGHIRAACPKLQCYYCNNFGHLKRNCPFIKERLEDGAWQASNQSSQTPLGRENGMPPPP